MAKEQLTRRLVEGFVLSSVHCELIDEMKS